MIRVDTFEAHSQRPVIVGYALLPVFVDIETQEQPSRPSVLQFVLNDGGFQLPLFATLPLSDASSDVSAKLGASSVRVPCATVLVRLKRAKRVRTRRIACVVALRLWCSNIVVCALWRVAS